MAKKKLKWNKISKKKVNSWNQTFLSHQEVIRGVFTEYTLFRQLFSKQKEGGGISQIIFIFLKGDLSSKSIIWINDEGKISYETGELFSISIVAEICIKTDEGICSGTLKLSPFHRNNHIPIWYTIVFFYCSHAIPKNAVKIIQQ